MAAKHGFVLVKAPPKGTLGFTPIAPLYRVEHVFARLGRWRRLSRCYEGSATSARAWLEVAAVAYLFARSASSRPERPGLARTAVRQRRARAR
jgi:putative transposase